MRIVHPQPNVSFSTLESGPPVIPHSQQRLEGSYQFESPKFESPSPACSTERDDGLDGTIQADEPKQGDRPLAFSVETPSDETLLFSEGKEQPRIRGWATAEQKVWLADRRPEYHQVHENDGLYEFYERIVSDWLNEGWTWEEIGTTRLPPKAELTEENYQKKLKARAKFVSKVIISF